jgi:hypothetical protein
MAGNEKLRGAIRASLSDSHFSAMAARLSGEQLRLAIARRLKRAGIKIVVVAASCEGESEPYARAELVWQPWDGGEFERQTIAWRSANSPATFENAPLAGRYQSTPLGGLRAMRLTAFDRS